jgi:hypothetical protein
MKTISQIIAGAQALLNISFNPAGCFEEYLSDEYKTFLQMLRVIEEQTPALMRSMREPDGHPISILPLYGVFLPKGISGWKRPAG